MSIPPASIPPASIPQVFDRQLLRRRRDRAARTADDFDFLLQDVAARLLDRLSLVRKSLPLILDLGGAHGVMAPGLKARAGAEAVFSSDLSYPLAARAGGFVADEELLPVRTHSLDAIVSNLSLHWVNDLPGALAQIRHALKPDGVFLAALLGGETLRELRQVLLEAETEITGGASPRVSPFISLRDMGALMQRAQFALPVVDNEIITVEYSSPFKLMQDLRGMGAANASFNRLKIPTRRGVMLEAARLYQQNFGAGEGRVTASFEVIYAIGWSPHDSQQKPLKPGSAAARLADALDAQEQATDDIAG